MQPASSSLVNSHQTPLNAASSLIAITIVKLPFVSLSTLPLQYHNFKIEILRNDSDISVLYFAIKQVVIRKLRWAGSCWKSFVKSDLHFQFHILSTIAESSSHIYREISIFHSFSPQLIVFCIQKTYFCQRMFL